MGIARPNLTASGSDAVEELACLSLYRQMKETSSMYGRRRGSWREAGEVLFSLVNLFGCALILQKASPKKLVILRGRKESGGSMDNDNSKLSDKMILISDRNRRDRCKIKASR